MLTYGGMPIESSPSGPLICTVDIACTREALAFAEGEITWKVTPWGTESGRDPIFDWHGVVVVKVLYGTGLANAGSRKASMESLGWIDAFVRLWAHRRRAEENMVVNTCNCSRENFPRLRISSCRLLIRCRWWGRIGSAASTSPRSNFPASFNTAKLSSPSVENV